MTNTTYTAVQASARAKEIYERVIRDKVEPQHNGKYLVMSLDSGDYVVGDDHLAVSDLAAAKFPDATRFGIRVGEWVVGRIGGRLKPVGS